MLQSLHIENYVLIDSLDIEFPEGLVIITGQTGAGKSILLGAVSLLLGAKADASVISRGADNCVVEGTFLLSGRDDLRDFFEANDLCWPEDDVVIIRRVVSSSGRSRSFICDEPAPVSVLQALGAQIIDIHSQHRSLLLSDRKFQLSVLDAFAGNGKLLEDCAASWKKLGSLKSELNEIQERLRKAESERDYYESRLEKLKAAGLRDGEMEELEMEQKQLANAEQIRGALMGADQLFCPDEGSGVLSSLKEIARQLASVSEYMPQMQDYVERIESARIDLSDIEQEVSTAAGSVDASEARLAEVESRLSTLYELLHRYQCTSVDELIALRDQCQSLLGDSSELELRIDELKAEMAREEAVYKGCSDALSASRTSAAPSLAGRIVERLRLLELDKAQFIVDVTPSEPSQNGADSCSFLFSSTGKTDPQDLSKCASGGELSRIMLSLKAVMAEFSAMPTLVFDEIDTGVSGSVADAMGQIICSMGSSMQVVAITHLPQVAAKGSAHFVVTKLSGDDKVVSTISKVEGEDRVREIARLLSGASITTQAMENARSLLAGN